MLAFIARIKATVNQLYSKINGLAFAFATSVRLQPTRDCKRIFEVKILQALDLNIKSANRHNIKSNNKQ
jgi:hypothetical protein